MPEPRLNAIVFPPSPGDSHLLSPIYRRLYVKLSRNSFYKALETPREKVISISTPQLLYFLGGEAPWLYTRRILVMLEEPKRVVFAAEEGKSYLIVLYLSAMRKPGEDFIIPALRRMEVLTYTYPPPPKEAIEGLMRWYAEEYWKKEIDPFRDNHFIAESDFYSLSTIRKLGHTPVDKYEHVFRKSGIKVTTHIYDTRRMAKADVRFLGTFYPDELKAKWKELVSMTRGVRRDGA